MARVPRWVVTYDCQWGNRRHLSAWYEGSEAECRRIMGAFVYGSDDRQPSCDWRVMVGPLRDWKEFLREQHNT